MPLEVLVELQIRAVSCPGVFLPSKQDVYLGIYFLNRYLETDCFPPVFPIMIHQNMRFEKVFKNAIDPGAVADILEVWEKLAYYEENTRDFLFPEPKLTPSHPSLYREVLMRTTVGFPGIAPKLEFSTRTAIRERVCLYRNRFPEDRHKPQRPLFMSPGPVSPLNSIKIKPRGSHLDRTSRQLQSRSPSPLPTRPLFQDQPTHLNFGNRYKIAREIKPPFVVRHVDSAKPFGEATSEHRPRKSRRKCKLSNFPFPMRRASSLDRLAANVKVIKEPDERIVIRNDPPSPRDSSKFGKSLPSSRNPGDADFHRETSLATSRHSRSPSPLLQDSFHSTWKKIHERVCSLLTFHGVQQPNPTQEDSTSEVNSHLHRQAYPLKKYPLHKKSYFKSLSFAEVNSCTFDGGLYAFKTAVTSHQRRM
ncbi:PREDICTED: spermatogenesis associated 6-like protein [Chrysochloris asiatica]|uniref:Spermatogenesis associated 6-like protein n=1 Tax=Chrysochloris asiatica TaxID=185453 RepID=A0A9B0WP83_CHRAS|nr:PREDICTED: spermatogenesis associated 6-like protein [Chrysochloris asiatica]